MGRADLKRIFFEWDVLPWLRLPERRGDRWRRAFLHQLSSCVQAELGLKDSLDICIKEGWSARARRTLKNVQAALEEGHDLSDALRKHAPNVFPESFLGILHMGEKSGQLAGALKILDESYEWLLMIKRRAQTMLLYPFMQALVSFGVIFFLILRVVPTFKEIFDDMHAPFPLPTRVLISFSEAIGSNIPIALAVLMALILIPIVFYRLAKRSARFNRYLSRLPSIGPIHLRLNLFYFSSLFSMLLKSGMDTDTALSLCERDMQWPLFRNAARKIRELCLEGKTFSEALREQKIFPPTFIWFAAVGEQRGNLADTLYSAAEYESTTAHREFLTLMQMAEPAGIVLMSILIGAIVIAMAYPILGMSYLLF